MKTEGLEAIALKLANTLPSINWYIRVKAFSVLCDSIFTIVFILGLVLVFIVILAQAYQENKRDK